MKRFLLFAYGQYYPNGGVNDIHSMYETLEDAKLNLKLLLSTKSESYSLREYESGHILDTLSGIVYESYSYSYTIPDSIQNRIDDDNRWKNV